MQMMEKLQVDQITGLSPAIAIEQKTISRKPRSNPGTYVSVLGEIRNVLAQTPEVKALGYKPDRFSFNVKGGRCEAQRVKLDVIKTANWIIDLGPEGGQNGGDIVAEGPPAEIAISDTSYTGRYLRSHL